MHFILLFIDNKHKCSNLKGISLLIMVNKASEKVFIKKIEDGSYEKAGCGTDIHFETSERKIFGKEYICQLVLYGFRKKNV